MLIQTLFIYEFSYLFSFYSGLNTAVIGLMILPIGFTFADMYASYYSLKDQETLDNSLGVCIGGDFMKLSLGLGIHGILGNMQVGIFST